MPSAASKKKQPHDNSRRGPEVIQLMNYFDYDHLPAGPMRRTSMRCAKLAQEMFADKELDDFQLQAGLVKLLEAKDCFVRAALRSSR